MSNFMLFGKRLIVPKTQKETLISQNTFSLPKTFEKSEGSAI